jgi:ribose/xylose/arabinose/galactoside ABC-type transport system permease subunit
MTRMLYRTGIVMKLRTTWLYAVAGLAAALVAVSAVVQAVREGSWSPLISVSWLLAVIVATWPRTARRCLPRRRQAR